MENQPVNTSNWGRVFGLFFVMCVIILLAVGSYFFYSETDSRVELPGYKAVFLTNGQVYFGKISNFEGVYTELTDIFYLQLKDGTQAQGIEGSSDDITLIKLGSELHGPEDKMFINRDHILFIENLKEDSDVVKAILEYKE